MIHPLPARHPLMCSDCARFLVHDNRLACGAYPGAEVPAYLITCPLFTPRTSTPQPLGDDPDATQR